MCPPPEPRPTPAGTGGQLAPAVAQPATGRPARGLRRHGPRILLEVAVFLLFAALAVGMTWPLATDLSHRLISWGDPVFQAWTMAWDVHAWRSDPLRVFDANIFFPYRNTLAYSDTLFGQAALVAPVLVASANAILADNLAVLLALALSGFAMYLLVLDLTGSRLAGLVAGVAYAVAPARLAHLEHLHLLSAQWLPLGVLAARRALRGSSLRWAAALGAVVLLQGLFGVYFLYFLAVLLVIVVGTYLLGHPTRAALVATGKIAAACGVAGALLLPTLLPYLEVNHDLGAERGAAEVTQWSARATDWLAVGPHNRVWGDLLAAHYHRHLEFDLFPGLLLLLLAGIGLFNRRFGWERWVLVAIAAGSFLLSFGLVLHVGPLDLPGPYRIFYELLPGFKAIRVPARFGLLALVGLAGLAGLGLDLVLRAGRGWLAGRAALAGVALGLTAVLVLGVIAEDATRVPLPDPLPATLAEAKRPDYAWMAAHPAPAIEFPMGEGLIASAWPNFWSTMHWNPVVNGYSGIAPPAYYVFRDRMREFPSARTIRLLQGIGVRTVVYHADLKVRPADDPVLSKLGQFPELTEVVGAPDYVFQLREDPWMWTLAREVPEGQAVDLPGLASDPATFGMLAAILQRTGHDVYGQGALDYWRLPAAPSSTCYAVLPASASTAGTRYQGAIALRTLGDLTLYRAPGCR